MALKPLTDGPFPSEKDFFKKLEEVEREMEEMRNLDISQPQRGEVVAAHHNLCFKEHLRESERFFSQMQIDFHRSITC